MRGNESGSVISQLCLVMGSVMLTMSASWKRVGADERARHVAGDRNHRRQIHIARRRCR